MRIELKMDVMMRKPGQPKGTEECDGITLYLSKHQVKFLDAHRNGYSRSDYVRRMLEQNIRNSKNPILEAEISQLKDELKKEKEKERLEEAAIHVPEKIVRPETYEEFIKKEVEWANTKHLDKGDNRQWWDYVDGRIIVVKKFTGVPLTPIQYENTILQHPDFRGVTRDSPNAHKVFGVKFNEIKGLNKDPGKILT